MFGSVRARVATRLRDTSVARSSVAVRLLAAMLTAAALASVPHAAVAQQPGEDQPARPVMTPPKLIEFVEATFPPEAAAQGLSATVELELVIGVDGKVESARVVTPVGNGFDEAALEAARKFVFEPATRDGQPMKARVRYPYVFEQRIEEPPPPPPEAPPAPGRLEGQVLESDGRDPIVGAVVTVASLAEGAGEPFRVLTDQEGRFVIETLPPGTYSVHIEADEQEPRDEREEIVAGEATSVTYRMQELPDPEAFSAVARIPPPPREVTRRTIGKEQITRIPGTRGDALRTVELMPGVARPPLGSGVLIVRGSSPADTQALFEGLPVPILYHFGGLTSFVNSRLLEGIEFYPGNFSVRYGRRRGGIVEVSVADIPDDRFHGVADVNLVDASLLLSTPIGDDAQVAIAGRRSYLDVILGSAIDDDDVSVVAAPVYYDYQVLATIQPTSTDELRLMAFGSSDSFALLFEEPNDSDAATSGDLDLGTQFHRLHASWRKKISPKLEQDIDVAAGILDADFGLGEAFKFNASGNDIYGRAEWRGRINDAVRLIGGLDLFFLVGEFTYTGPPVGQSEGDPNSMGGTTFSNRDQITAFDEYVISQPALYLESEFTLGDLRLSLGSRIDYYSEIKEFSFDPRFSTHYALTETTSLKGGVGLFSQPPEFQESSPVLGNPDLDPTQTLHVGAGVDQTLTEGWTLQIDGFYKHLYDRIVGSELGVAPFFVNGGEGRIYGMEVALRVDPTGRLFGYLSYTLSRSERRDAEGDWRLFDFDQTHILTMAAVYRLGKGWEVGALFRLTSGNLFTPIEGSNLNVINSNYSPIFGALNSERDPAFHRLDVRVEKQWIWPSWKLALYLDVQNAYNRQNPEGNVCDFEFRECQPIEGLPILPILGLRGEM